MGASSKPGLSVNITSTQGGGARETAAALPMRMTISKVNFYYGSKQILFDINMGIADKKVTALIGNKKGDDDYYVKVPEAPQVFLVKKYNADRVVKRPIEFRDKTL